MNIVYIFYGQVPMDRDISAMFRGSITSKRFHIVTDEPLLSHSMRFMGSMIVSEDRGEKLVQEAIRQIMASRAIHNVFRSPECVLTIGKRRLNLMDSQSDCSSRVLARFDLSNIAFWMTHKENDRLFAFITRSPSDPDANTEFRCHVFESATPATEVGDVLSDVTKAAYREYLARIEQKS